MTYILRKSESEDVDLGGTLPFLRSLGEIERVSGCDRILGFLVDLDGIALTPQQREEAESTARELLAAHGEQVSGHTRWLLERIVGRDIDTLVAETIAQVASDFSRRPGESFLESRLEEFVVAALERQFSPCEVIARKRLGLPLTPDWDPQPGAIDVAVRDGSGVRLAMELKIDDLHHSLWDVLKMASVARLPSVEAAYVVVAASHRTFSGDRSCGPLFSAEPGSRSWERVIELLARSRTAWSKMLAEARARPMCLPASLEVASIAAAPVASELGYELRAIRVEPDTDALVSLEAGWPTLDEWNGEAFQIAHGPDTIDERERRLGEVYRAACAALGVDVLPSIACWFEMFANMRAWHRP